MYTVEEHQAIIGSIVRGYTTTVKGAGLLLPPAMTQQTAAQKSWECCLLLAAISPAIKDTSFAEEQEWRLVSPMLTFGDGGVEFRPGRWSIIPYVPFPLDDESGQPGIAEVVIGPTIDQLLTSSALSNLMIARDIRMNITYANNAYREW